MDPEDLRKLVAQHPDADSLAAALSARLKGPLMQIFAERALRQQSTPRVSRFASTFATTGRWIDFGLKPDLVGPLLTWDDSEQKWLKVLRRGVFWGEPTMEPTVTLGSSFGPIFDEQQVERVVIWSRFGESAARAAYESWKLQLTTDLGEADLTKSRDLSHLKMEPCPILIWDSPIARAGLAVVDAKDCPVAQFRIRHKLTEKFELERHSHNRTDLFDY